MCYKLRRFNPGKPADGIQVVYLRHVGFVGHFRNVSHLYNVRRVMRAMIGRIEFINYISDKVSTLPVTSVCACKSFDIY